LRGMGVSAEQFQATGAAKDEPEKSTARLRIAARIWLAVGIFVLGFIFCTTLAQVQGRNTEGRLQETSEALFPAAMLSREAEAAFHRAQKGFSDAVVMQDLEGLNRGAAGGREAVQYLRSLAALSGLPESRRQDARKLAAAVAEFLRQAHDTYEPAAAHREIPPQAQRQMRELAVRTEELEIRLARLKEEISGGLQETLRTLQARSVRDRGLGLWVFGTTLVLSGFLVNLTIRRTITTPLRRAEAALAHERDLLRTLLDNIPDYISFKNAEGKYVRVNHATSLLLGIRGEEEAEGKTAFDFLEPEAAQDAEADEREVIETGQPMVSKIERLNIAQFPRWLMSTKVPIKDASGRVHGIVGVSRDITDWKDAVESLEKSEQSFRLLFAAIPHAVWVFDAETLELLKVNDTAIQRYGYSRDEFLRIPIDSVLSESEIPRLMKALAAPNPARALSGTWKHQPKDGPPLDVEVGAQVFEFRGRRAVMSVVQDVTERKRLEAELHQAQRLESVGQLAAGIAHELNTPIQYVGDNLRFLQEAFQSRSAVFARYEEVRQAAEQGEVSAEMLAVLAGAIQEADFDYLGEEIPKALAQSLDGTERVATIVRAMKEFAHPGRKEKAAADLNKALTNTLTVARNELKYVADVETDFGELPAVVCDVAGMNQVFLNILINAAHAIGPVMKSTGKKGKITVRTRVEDGQAVITISDTGCGIPEQIRSKVFDPFFTTKPVGQGTGQGLSIARSIVVEKHGGALVFEPNGGQGTKFRISLPLGTGVAVTNSAVPEVG